MSTNQFSDIWQNLDKNHVLKTFEDSIPRVESLNFAVKFNDAQAEGALNLDAVSIKQLWEGKDLKPPSTNWINIWAPEKQVDLLNVLAEKYGFSPRLLGLMTSKPALAALPPSPSIHRHTHEFQRPWKGTKRRENDPEDHIPLHEKTPVRSGLLDLSHYRIVNEIWHYSSVDLGREYVCLGYNSLYNTHVAPSDDKRFPPKKLSKPAGRRVWSWLLLCRDGTVISIEENMYPDAFGPLVSGEPKDLGLVRRHTLDVLKRLSRAPIAANSVNPIMTLTIRSDPNSTDNQSPAFHISASDAPGLLFYYLFDDWYTTYSLVARKDHQYGTQLELLRAAMFETASLDHVNTLHHYGRQLAVLKRLYESYDRIIERVLDMQKVFQYSSSPSPSTTEIHTDNTQQVQQSDSNDNYTINAQHTQQSQSNNSPLSLGVPLSRGVVVRFQTLRDRIRLYALSEIQECLDEKEALVQVNFNLITMKESSAVETLTRITILLAKVTILFLPVSLMTSYFALQIPTIAQSFTLKIYWISFAVTMALSFLLIVVFGILSGTQESKTIYRSLTRTLFDKSRHAWSKESAPKDVNT